MMNQSIRFDNIEIPEGIFREPLIYSMWEGSGRA